MKRSLLVRRDSSWPLASLAPLLLLPLHHGLDPFHIAACLDAVQVEGIGRLLKTMELGRRAGILGAQ